jgi:hypothetical protein
MIEEMPVFQELDRRAPQNGAEDVASPRDV